MPRSYEFEHLSNSCTLTPFFQIEKPGPRVTDVGRQMARKVLSNVLELVEAEKASVAKAAGWMKAPSEMLESYLFSLPDDTVELGLVPGGAGEQA